MKSYAVLNAFNVMALHHKEALKMVIHFILQRQTSRSSSAALATTIAGSIRQFPSSILLYWEITAPLPEGLRKLCRQRDTLCRQRVALCGQRAAVDRRSRQPEGRIMQPEGGIMCPEGGINSVSPRGGVQ